MFNFKFIKLGWLFVLAFVLFSQNVSFAQEQQSWSRFLGSLNIKDVKIETSGAEIKISGKLFNQSQNIATDKITHLLILETIDPLIKPKNEIDQMPSLIVVADEGKDYFSLGPNKQKSFSYSLTVSQYVPEANYRVSLRFINSSGKEQAYHSDIIKNFGSSKKEGFLAFDQQSCVLFSKEGERFGNNAGPAFLHGESPKISCLIKNIGEQEIEVSPKILWKEVFVYSKPLEGKLAEEKQDEKIFFNPGESKTIALFMPIAEKPQTYQGLLSFEDKNGANRSFNEFFRWTIAGESARIKTVAQTGELKDFYGKGDKVALSVDYFGSSDLYWAGKQDVSNLSEMTMKAVIKDKNGSVCGEKEEIIDDITDGFSKNKEVEIILDKNCKEMSYSVSLSSGQKSLAEQSGNLPKVVNNQKNLQYLYFGAPAFLILLAFYFFIRKKSVPVYFFIFAIAGIAMFSGMALAVEKRIYPASGGNAYAIEWGGEWANDGSAILYSTAYSTGGLNKLRPDEINAQLSGFFISNDNIGSVAVAYTTDDTACVNTSMEVEYKVLITTEGLSETLLTTKHIVYNSNTGSQLENVSIPPENIQSLYDDSGIPRKNPKLIVEMKQIGIYNNESSVEFTETYEFVGEGEGSYGYNWENSEYFPLDGGGYNLVKTANINFYPGLFSSAESSKTSKSNAYALADTARIEIPLTLPVPTLRINPPTATLNPGETKQFKVFYDADGPNYTSPEEDVTNKIKLGGLNNWSSDKTSVVKVNETGLATAVAQGATKIKAVYYRGLNAEAQVYVPSLRIKPAVVTTMLVGTEKQFNAYYDIHDGQGETKITSNGRTVWTSDNSSVVSVVKGLISAKEKGMANISISYKGLLETTSVIVESGLIVNCSADKTNANVNENVVFTAYPEGGTGVYSSYKWTGDVSGSLSAVTSSFATAGVKTAVIEVKDNSGKTATNNCSVVVGEEVVPYYDIEPISETIGENETTQFKSFFYPNGKGDNLTIYPKVEKTFDNSVSWTIDDNEKSETVASVGQKTGVATCYIGGVGIGNEKSATVFSEYTEGDITYEASASLLCTKDATGICEKTKDSCADGDFRDKEDSAEYYLWECAGTVSTSSCSLKKDKVTVEIYADKTFASIGDTAEIEWNSENAVSCVPSIVIGTDTGWTSVERLSYYDTRGAYETDKFTALPITYKIECSGANNDKAVDSVTIGLKNPDSSYKINPSVAKAGIKQSVSFEGWYDSGETNAVSVNVTNSAEWNILDSDGNIDKSGVNATIGADGIAVCKAEKDNVRVHSFYTKGGSDLQDEASLNCSITPPPQHSLTVNVVGKGTVSGATGDSVAWSCGDNCVKHIENYGKGSEVWLSAEGTDGYVFKSYKVEDVDENKNKTASTCNREYVDSLTDIPSCDLIMTTNKEVMVTFEPDPSYNISPDLASAYINGTKQFTGSYDSGKTGTSESVIGVTNLANWTSSNTSIATITTGGISGRGVATCLKLKEEGITITSTYTDENKKTFTDTAILSCLSIDPPNRTLTVNIIGKGEVDGLVNCENLTGNKTTCVGQLKDDESGYLRATPVAGYTFSLNGWAGSCAQPNVFISNGADDYSEGDYVCDLTMTTNKEVTVTFEPDPSYYIEPEEIKIKINETVQFTGIYDPDGVDNGHYGQDKTDSAEWKTVDDEDNENNSIATFKFSGAEKGKAKCLAEGTAIIYSSYGGIVDYAKLICENAPTVYYTLTVKKTGDGNGEITGSKEIYCDANCSFVSANFPAGSVIELTATELNDSSFGSWSGDCVVSADETSVCEITMMNDKDATASFTKDTAFPTAYISADKTNLAVGEEAVLSWGSDNATSCVNDDNDADSGWADTNQKNDINGNYKTKVFGQEEERIYSVTCFDNFENEDSASITISSSSDEPETPAVDFWNTPDIVDFDNQANLLWLSENTKSCEISSDDDSSFKSVKKTNLASNGELKTGSLSEESSTYVYTIKCLGDDGSYAEDQTVVETKEKQCESDCVTQGGIIITIADYIEANIVAGLPANSTKKTLNITGTSCEDSKYALSVSYDDNWKGNLYFKDKIFPQNEKRTLPEEGDFFVKNIPGKTPAGKYPITITATCVDADDENKTITANRIIYLIVKRIGSIWQEI